MRRLSVIAGLLLCAVPVAAQAQVRLTEPTESQIDSFYQAERADTLSTAVVTGYSRTTVRRVTGSVAVLSGDVFAGKPAVALDALMAGEVAGVAVRATSGQPGTQAKIRIRGTSNLSGNSEPLWVVDGVPVQNESGLSGAQLAAGGVDDIFFGGIGHIDPNDIENVTILKDAAAAAIYGSRAANGVIVVTTRRGRKGRPEIGYSTTLSAAFRPQRSMALMSSAEKIDWEQTLWDEFSAARFAAAQDDPTRVYPVIGIVGQVRSGAGPFAGMSRADQDAYLDGLKAGSTDWYSELFRNTLSHQHHLSVSGGSDRIRYYVSGGYNDNRGLLVHNRYQRLNLNADLTWTPSADLSLDFGLESSRQLSRTPESSVNAFTYAYFANPYEQARTPDGGYGSDRTWFTLGYYNGRGAEEVLPDEGFSLLRELDLNRTTTVNTAHTFRAQADWKLLPVLTFTGLASCTPSRNVSERNIDAATFSAFRDRLGYDDKAQDKRYGSLTRSLTKRFSYLLRGHLNWKQALGPGEVNLIGGSEIRASASTTRYRKMYNYDPATDEGPLPPVSGPVDEWQREVARLTGDYYDDTRFASFYLTGDYYWKNLILNTAVRADGSSSFGVNRQFQPTWSAGVCWHFADGIPWLSHGALRGAYGYTGNVNAAARHLLTMEYLQNEYRYADGSAYPLVTIPSAPNPDLGWEKTADLKASLDVGFFYDVLSLQAEVYRRLSSDVVTTAQVLSTSGFTSAYYNTADIRNDGVEATLSWRQSFARDFRVRASANVAWNRNEVTRFTPAFGNRITAKDRYVEGYPAGAIFAGDYGGIDPSTGLYAFRLRDDADLKTAADLGNADNYRTYLGTTIAPWSGGCNISLDYKRFRLSASGVFFSGGKAYDKIVSPASYLNARHEGMPTEEVQSQYSDLYANHLNVTRERTSRWTEATPAGVLYPRIYDRFDARYNFAHTNPMEGDIVDAIYLKDVSYFRLKSVILSWNLPETAVRKVRLQGLRFTLTLGNILTLTAYDGMDPEVPGATYPTSRSVSFGAHVTL